MIVINSVNAFYFEIDGTRMARIYQPLAQGSQAISIVNIYDTRQKLLNSTKYDEVQVDGAVYGSQSELIEALLLIVYSPQGSGGSESSGVYGETPSGVVDGVNTVFNITVVPVAGTARVCLNGIRQINEVAIVGAVITFDEAPFVGDVISVDYDI